MRKSAIIHGLKVNLAWLQSQAGKRSNPRGSLRAEETRNACIRFCAEVPQPLEAWSRRRKGRRAALADVRSSYRIPGQSRHLQGLVILTISALEAAAWIDTMGLPCLPMSSEPKPLSEVKRRSLDTLHAKRALGLRERLAEARQRLTDKPG